MPRAKKKPTKPLIATADKLEALAANLTKIEIPGFSPEKGEKAFYRLPTVALTEWRSTGSSYQGGSQGVSIRIAKGLSYRVGASRGTLTKNPEQLQVVDQGSAIFTDQRIIFVGAKVNREWQLDKLLNVDAGANGVYVNIAVSNRQKNSGLQDADSSELTPGILTAIAVELHERTTKDASAYALDVAGQMRALAQPKKNEAS